MFNIKPPQTSYSSLEDVGKFNMLWNISLVLVPIFITLCIIHIFFSDPSWITSVLAATVAIVNLIVLKTSKKYRIISATTVIFGVIICQAVIFLVNDSMLISDLMWCILVAFFAFFVISVRVGTFVLLLNLTGIVLFLLNGSVNDILSKGISIEEVDYRMIINVFYVALALAYVISRMVATNKKMNKDYEDQMKHKQILLKEIHHRVKNNLQIVSSLLRLQAAETENKIVEEEFGEAIGRIRSMALIHETMYQNDDLATLDIKSYLTSLAQDISETIKSDTVLEINIGSEVNKVDVKYVVSLSLIFNELMTNSIKHGFSNKEKGTIDVKIINSGEIVTFNYSDDGNWKQPISDTTFGLELLETLTEQLDGNLVRTINNGTNYTLSFDNKILLFENEV